MTQPTPYQYVKLGSNLEFLRGISSASVMQTANLAGCLACWTAPQRGARFIHSLARRALNQFVEGRPAGMARAAQ